MIKLRYFLLVTAATTLSSCETYNAMRQTPNQRINTIETTEEEDTIAQGIAPLPIELTTLPKAPKTGFTPPRNVKRSHSRDTGLSMRPHSLSIPASDDLKETSTSTQKVTPTPGLTVPN